MHENDKETLSPTYFIQNRVLHKLWRHVFQNKWQVDENVFRQAFGVEFGEGILNGPRMEDFTLLVNGGRSAILT